MTESTRAADAFAAFMAGQLAPKDLTLQLIDAATGDANTPQADHTDTDTNTDIEGIDHVLADPRVQVFPARTIPRAYRLAGIGGRVPRRGHHTPQ